jgi:CO/xanthine dehydrogenase Mo-binding subunit
MDSARFVSDIYLPQMLYAHTIRSPVAKGRLINIERPKLPPGYILITAKDIPGKNSLGDSSHPILAGEELSYIGEPLALLLGPDKNTLEDCAKNCKVVAEEGTPDEEIIAARRDIRIGDADAALAGAESVLRGNYSTGIQELWNAEPQGAVAWLNDTDDQDDQDDQDNNGLTQTRGEKAKKSKTSKKNILVVQTATQWLFHVRRSVAQVLGLADSAVLVKPAKPGLFTGGRLWYPSLIACHAALGAWIAKKPVRVILSRTEDFYFAPKRCGTEIAISSAHNEKGNISGIEINATVNLGAYEINAKEILDHVYLGTLGVYNTKNITFSGIAIRTNTPPQGPFAGFGYSQGAFALERHVSRIAENCNQDPSQWRTENYSKSPPGFLAKNAVPHVSLIDTVTKISDYRRKWASYELLRQNHRGKDTASSWAQRGESLRGIGIAMGYQGAGLLYIGVDKNGYSMEVTLEKDMALEIKTTMVGSGNDYQVIWGGIASEILGPDVEKLQINCGDEFVDSGPSVASRNITFLTKLFEQCCREISKQRLRRQLPITVRKTIRPPKNPVFDERFPNPEPQQNPDRSSADSLPENNEYIDYSGFVRPGWAAAVVEVETDSVEYLPRLRGVWISVDGGKIFSEDRARRSLKTAVVQALGWAYREQISYVNGAIPREQFENFTIPGPSEIPPVNIEFIKNDSDEPKGIGDLPYACIPAAYLQAVSQAIDYHFESIPLKPADIWYADIKKKKGESPA